MSELRKLLAYNLEQDSTERDRALNSMTPELRKLLQTEGVESTTLIQTEFSKTVLEGAKPAMSARQWLPLIRIKTNAFDWPLRPAATYATKVGEGASSPAAEMDYSKRTFTTYKISQAAEISEELVEDGLYDVINMEVENAALACEMRLNRDAIDTIMDNAGSNVDTAGNACSVTYLAAACKALQGNGYRPDTLVMASQAWYGLMTDSNLVYTAYAGTDSTLKTGKVFPIFGLKAHLCDVVSNGTATWGGSADNKMAMVLDSKKAGGIAMRRDLTTKKFADVRRDLQGAVVSMRYDVNYLQANAACTIQV